MTEGELTPREVAEELGVTVRTVQRWLANGTLPGTRVGGRLRVSRSSLAAVAGVAPAANAGPIRSLFVANRGEIAERVARSARAMGVRVVGVHASGERPGRGADESTQIGSYLDGDELVRAARAAGADAVHPGYGFLAENADFARAVIAAGMRWVGPPQEAIAAMGDKAEARRRAAALGVPVVPGYDDAAQDDETLVVEAARIGLPLLVKPTAGGGGKGMRVVRQAADLSEALAAARREADRSFGDDRLILERYLERPRHVEVQVLFDSHGSGVHLGERDCSAQRRNQKVVEEAPAPSVTPDLRERMTGAALRLASAVGYASAGTVEMLLTDDGEFFFLEMNTRLQVEHPVTEAITGRDIVADQLRIAAGETLGALGLGKAPPFRGHAIEARLYAEDPDAGFLPATGRLVRLSWPPGIRVDTGVEEGDVVTDRYDPMLAKLIVHGRTRGEALGRLRAALDATTVLGVRTNLRFLRWLVGQPAMAEGEMRTDTIAGAELPRPPQAAEADWLAAAHVLRADDRDDPWAGGWRLNALPVVRVQHGDDSRSCRVAAAMPAANAVRDGDVAYVDVGGQSLEFRLAPAPAVDEAARRATSDEGGATSALTAPMPGRVISVRVAEGDSVAANAPLVVIEAMKMEHAVVAPRDGRVVRVAVAEGAQVERGETLVEVEGA